MARVLQYISSVGREGRPETFKTTINSDIRPAPRFHPSSKTAFGRLVLVAALAALPILTACGDNREKGPEVQTVEVHLKDGTIQRPASLPSGMTTFEVVNEGNQALSFEIEGPGGTKDLPTMQPGQTASVDTILDPGTYRVHAPENQQMVVALIVTPS